MLPICCFIASSKALIETSFVSALNAPNAAIFTNGFPIVLSATLVISTHFTFALVLSPSSSGFLFELTIINSVTFSVNCFTKVGSSIIA